MHHVIYYITFSSNFCLFKVIHGYTFKISIGNECFQIWRTNSQRSLFPFKIFAVKVFFCKSSEGKKVWILVGQQTSAHLKKSDSQKTYLNFFSLSRWFHLVTLRSISLSVISQQIFQDYWNEWHHNECNAKKQSIGQQPSYKKKNYSCFSEETWSLFSINSKLI